MCSILDQGYPNLEYIVIDGGSTDQSVEIIKKYGNRLSHWVSEPDSGMYDAINKGFNVATGEIMCWLNSDDIHLEQSLFKVALLFQQNPKMQWLRGYPTIIDMEDSIIFSVHWNESKSKIGFLKKVYFWPKLKIVHSSIPPSALNNIPTSHFLG